MLPPLLSYWIVSKTGRIDVVRFDDEECGPYLIAVLNDVFEVFGTEGR
jgi:hypothetical protein